MVCLGDLISSTPDKHYRRCNGSTVKALKINYFKAKYHMVHRGLMLFTTLTPYRVEDKTK